MILKYNWEDYSDTFNMPVDGMARYKEFDSQHVNYYVDNGNLYLPDYLPYINWAPMYVYYIEINGVARVFDIDTNQDHSDDDIHKCVNYVQELSVATGRVNPNTEKGKLIKTIAQRKYAGRYWGEAGACLFVSHHHPCPDMREIASNNAAAMQVIERHMANRDYAAMIDNITADSKL